MQHRVPTTINHWENANDDQKYIPYIAEAMLDANDTEPEYYNVQGTMLIDPAISPDVALVESKQSGLLRLATLSLESCPLHMLE